jgi:hypothetical protein
LYQHAVDILRPIIQQRLNLDHFLDAVFGQKFWPFNWAGYVSHVCLSTKRVFLVGQVWGVALLALLSAIFFGLLIGAKRVQTRRRLQWLQKQRNTGHRYVGLETQELTGCFYQWGISLYSS